MHVFVAVNNAKNFLRLAAAQFSAEASVSGHGQKSNFMFGFQIKRHVLTMASQRYNVVFIKLKLLNFHST